MKKLFITFLLLFNSLISFGYECHGNLMKDVEAFSTYRNLIIFEESKNEKNILLISLYVNTLSRLLSHILEIHRFELSPDLRKQVIKFKSDFEAAAQKAGLLVK